MRRLFGRPLISVILASYNHEAFIGQAITSVLDQDIDDLELIVVDDGSSDGTAERAEQFRDARVRVIRLSENRRFQTRNHGLEPARGKYIAFQNSDDVWKKNKLKHQLDILESNKHISVCFTGVDIIDEAGNLKQSSWAENQFTTENRSRSAWLRHFFDVGNCLCIASAVTRRKTLLHLGGFHPALIQLSDFDLWVRMAAIGDLHIISDPLTSMRIVGDKNISGPIPSGMRRSCMESLDVLNRFREKPLLKRFRDVFPDVITPDMKSDVIMLAALARYSWHLSSPHILFGNQIISDLLVSNADREKLVRYFGTSIIHDFIYNRSRIDLAKVC
jgi:glycosyltransferase involved in cell wall biosynthesis